MNLEREGGGGCGFIIGVMGELSWVGGAGGGTIKINPHQIF